MSTVTMLYGVARLFAFAALALLIGAAFFLAGWWPEGSRYPAMRRLVWSAWSALVVATGVVLLLFGPQLTQAPLSSAVDLDLLSITLETRMGAAVLVRLLLLALIAPLLALLLARLASPMPGGRAWRVGGVLGGAALLAATWSVAGHSAVGRQAVIALPVDVVHLVAMGVWLGGLVVLCGVLLRTGEIATMRSVGPAFSRAALVCVAALVVTGSYQSWRQVGSPTALVTTSYGWLLVGKVVLVILLIGIGALSRAWVHRYYGEAPQRSISAKRRARRGPGRQEVARLRRMVGAEAGIAAVVLAVTAVLVTNQPARSAQIEAAAAQRAEQARAGVNAQSWPTPVTARIGFDTGGVAAQGTVDLAVFPAAVGRNEIHLSVLDTAGALLDVPETTVMLTSPDRSLGPIAVALRKLAAGHYIGTVTIPATGQWQLAVTVGTSEVDRDTITAPVDVR
ncbi:MAG: FixH family protein [Pseudonocardiaceae bacterium]